MSNTSGSGAKGPRKRTRLPRQRKSFRCDLRVDVYRTLKALARVDEQGVREPLIAVVERLILDARRPLDPPE